MNTSVLTTTRAYVSCLKWMFKFADIHATTRNEPLADNEEPRLRQAEIEGYESVLDQLKSEALEYERNYIAVYQVPDETYWCAMSKQEPLAQGVGDTELAALINLRTKLIEMTDSDMLGNKDKKKKKDK